MKLTNHAQRRCQQRGIPQEVVELILQFGQPHERPGGAMEYRLRDRDKPQLVHRLKHLLQQVESAAGKGVVVSEEDRTVITVYHLTS